VLSGISQRAKLCHRGRKGNQRLPNTASLTTSEAVFRLLIRLLIRLRIRLLISVWNNNSVWLLIGVRDNNPIRFLISVRNNNPIRLWLWICRAHFAILSQWTFCFFSIFPVYCFGNNRRPHALIDANESHFSGGI